MNWLRKLILGKEAIEQLKAVPNYHGLQPGTRYQIENGRIVTPPDNFNTYVRDGYSTNDIIYSIVNLILDKVRLPDWMIYKVVDGQESSLKKYRSLMARKDLTAKEYKEALRLKENALEPISKYSLQQGKLRDLLEYPNDYCTFQDLISEAMMFKLITGNDYLWGKDILQNGANAGIPNSIVNLPPQFMNIKITEDLPPEPAGYWIFNPWNKTFAVEEILHNKYANPNWDINGQQLYGMSPLKAALKNVIRNNSAKDAATAKLQNGGLEEIVYFDDEKFNASQGRDQLQALKNQLTSSEYRGPDAQGTFAISGYKVGKVGLGLSPVELAIIDSEKWDAMMFCNIYGVPPELLGITQKTYNNMKEAYKALITGSVLPLLTSIRNDFNRKIQGDWGGFTGIYVDYDTECFPELHIDSAEVVKTTAAMMMLTPNEEREALGWELIADEPLADEQWVMQNGSRVPLSDFQPNPVDNILNAMQNGQQSNGNASGANGSGTGQGNQSASNGAVSQNGLGKNVSH